MSIGDLSRINTNVQSMQALGQLNKTNSELGIRQLRLATGSRLNRAEDDSAGYTIANKLQAKTRGQAQALSNIGDAKGMLTIGEGALNSTMDILQTMKEKAVQAANDTMGTEERSAIQSQIEALTQEIGDTLAGAEFNGKSIFGGTDTLNNGSTGTALSFQVGSSASDSFGVEIAAVDVEGLAIGDIADSDVTAAASTATASNFTDASAGGVDETAVTINDASGYAGTTDRTIGVTVGAGTNSGVSLTYTDSNGDSQTIDDLAADTEVNLDGILVEVGAAVADGDTFDIGAVAAVEGVTAGDVSSALDVSSVAGAQSAITAIDSAISTVNNAVSGLGDSQARLSIKQDNLDTSMTNYEAARSRIEDTDFAKEQMEIVKLQILQQTGIGSLAQANAGPQSVLSLIG